MAIVTVICSFGWIHFSFSSQLVFGKCIYRWKAGEPTKVRGGGGLKTSNVSGSIQETPKISTIKGAKFVIERGNRAAVCSIFQLNAGTESSEEHTGETRWSYVSYIIHSIYQRRYQCFPELQHNRMSMMCRLQLSNSTCKTHCVVLTS